MRPLLPLHIIAGSNAELRQSSSSRAAALLSCLENSSLAPGSPIARAGRQEPGCSTQSRCQSSGIQYISAQVHQVTVVLYDPFSQRQLFDRLLHASQSSSAHFSSPSQHPGACAAVPQVLTWGSPHKAPMGPPSHPTHRVHSSPGPATDCQLPPCPTANPQ